MMTGIMNRREFVSSSFSLAAPLGLAGQTAGAPNAEIEASRQAALDLLKPTQAQLQRGLELHASATVVESYGFSPRSAVDGDALRAAMEAGASDAELQDLREEMTMTRAATNAAEREEYLSAWRAAGVTAILQNAGEEGQDPLRLIKRLARFTFTTDQLRPHVTRGVNAADIESARARNAHCLVMTGNGVPLPQRWDTVQEELGYVRLFHQLGIRMMHLTYNRRNMLGDGCAEAANAGLSDFGRAAIAEMNRAGVILDVAHSGWQSSLEAAEASTKPMVASHSVCGALNPHIRSKPDNVIRAIVNTGGFMGICCISSFLGRSHDIVAMLDHIDYMVKRFGADHVTIGTDIAYQSRASNAEYAKVPKSQRRRARFDYFWPPNALAVPFNRSLAWTNWPLFTVGMVQRGHSDEAILKILGGNVLRVLRAAAV
jgi:membrane dipeptidase